MFSFQVQNWNSTLSETFVLALCSRHVCQKSITLPLLYPVLFFFTVMRFSTQSWFCFFFISVLPSWFINQTRNTFLNFYSGVYAMRKIFFSHSIIVYPDHIPSCNNAGSVSEMHGALWEQEGAWHGYAAMFNRNDLSPGVLSQVKVEKLIPVWFMVNNVWTKY